MQQPNNIHPAFQASPINAALQIAFQATPINSALLNFNQMPDCSQVRLPIVKALLSVSSATVWRLVKAGHLKTYKLTERTTTFNCGEIRAFLASKVAA